MATRPLNPPLRAATPDAVVEAVRIALEPLRDPVRAEPMAAYMQHHFAFLGIGAPARRAAIAPSLRKFAAPQDDELFATCDLLWAADEREYQQVACDYLAAHIARCAPAFALPRIERLIVTKSWWDTVDVLCRSGAGAVVQREPSLRSVMDRWLASDDVWLIRSAILHQERWKHGVDFAWLRAACLRHAERREFFVRKAIGWSLRTYANGSPDQADEVRALLDEAPFSGLTRREALKRVRH